MIDRHYGHLDRDGRDHAIKLLDSYPVKRDRRPRRGRCTSKFLAYPENENIT
jgi:hypothetical protein